MADNLFNNKFTVVNIIAGREYYFRVFAKNDMGLSPPSVSPVFAVRKEKGLFLSSVPSRIWSLKKVKFKLILCNIERRILQEGWLEQALHTKQQKFFLPEIVQNEF